MCHISKYYYYLHLLFFVNNNDICCSHKSQNNIQKVWDAPYDNQILKNTAIFKVRNLKKVDFWTCMVSINDWIRLEMVFFFWVWKQAFCIYKLGTHGLFLILKIIIKIAKNEQKHNEKISSVSYSTSVNNKVCPPQFLLPKSHPNNFSLSVSYIEYFFP